VGVISSAKPSMENSRSERAEYFRKIQHNQIAENIMIRQK
jgi:hypothetical protein